MNKKKVKNILLINCALTIESRKKIKEAVSSPNLGLMSIASILIMHGYHVEIMDFFVEQMTRNEFSDKIKTLCPDIIGFSVYTRTVPFLKKIVKILDKCKYKGYKVAGGPHASYCQEELILHYGMDYVISGEGEFIFLKLMEYLNYKEKYPIEKIRGISYLDNSYVVNNEKADYIEYLDALPLQPINLINAEEYSSPFTLITSRGCPGNCIYCASRYMAGSRYRMRSAENIICEIDYLYRKLKKKHFIILDDTFTANKERFFKFSLLIKKYSVDIDYRIESRGDVLTQEILETLKETKCKVVHVGIESGSQSVIYQIGKNIDLNNTINLIIHGAGIGIHMVASFIIGNYCDSSETIEETLNLMQILKNNGVEVSVASCTPFPGTPLYKNREKLGVQIHTKSWQDFDFGNVIISTRYLSRNELRDYLFKAIQICM